MLDIVRIDEKNIEYFKAMMTEEIALRACLEIGAIALGVVDVDKGNEVVGEIVCAVSGEDFNYLNILSLYVMEEYRKGGVALELINRVIEIAETFSEYDGIGVDFIIDHVNENNLYSFFKNLDFELTEEPYKTYTCTIGDGIKSKRIERVDVSEVKTLKELDKLEMGRILRESDISDARRIEMGLMDEDMSVCLFSDKGLVGQILVSKESDEIAISWADIDADYSMKLISLMARMMKEGAKKYSPDTVLHIPVVDDSMDKITRMMLGDSLKLIETQVHGYKDFDDYE